MKLNSTLLLTVLFLFSGFTLIAQKATFKGTIKDEKGEPIFSASVIIDVNAGLATTTDFDGNYKLMLDPGKYTVKYKYVGKEDQTQVITVAAGETKVVNVSLKEREEIMNVVVVSASKYEKKLSEETVTIEVMKSNQLQQQNVKDMEDGIKRVPGVTVVDGQANIRGGSGWSYGAGSRVMVLVDDIPLLSADASDAKWSMVPIENMEQVEVLKGAASALYGSSALNGVINMRTAWPGEQTYLKAIMYGGLYQKPRNTNMAWWARSGITLKDSTRTSLQKDQPSFGGFNIGFRKRFGNFDLVLGGSYQTDHSYLVGGSSSNYRVSAKTRYRFKGKAEGLTAGVNVTFFNSWGSTFFLWNGLDSMAYFPLSGTASNYITYRVTVDPHITYVDKHENKYSFRGRWFNATNTNDTKQGSIPNRYFGDIQFSRFFRGPKIGFVAGVSGYYDDVKGALIGTHTGYNVSAYAQADVKLVNRVSLAFGARYEYFTIDQYKSKYRPVFRGGINVQAAKATYIRASVGEGYRFPTMAEKFIRTNVGAVGIYPNPGLQSETGLSVELGIKQGYKFGKGNWMGFVDLAGFYNSYKNMMEFTFGKVGYYNFLDPNDPKNDPLFGLGFSAQNVGNTRILGGEFVWTLTGKVKNTPITLMAGYSYIDPKYTNWNDTIAVYDKNGNIATGSRVPYRNTVSSDRNILKYRNRHTVKADFETTLFGHLMLGTTLQFNSYMENIDKFFVNEAVNFETAGLLTGSTFHGLKDYREGYKRKGDIFWDLRAAYSFKDHFKIAFMVKNLLNQFATTRPAYPDPPRNFTLQLTYDL